MNNKLLRILITISALTTLASINAAPQLQSIVEGSTTIQQTSSNTIINQTSNQTIINWNSFNINNNESVTFNQPSASAIAINQILDSNPSQILGSITANGRIILLNPQGFYFGANSSVSANTFIVAATDISNTNYNAINNQFTINHSSLLSKDITTHGTINARHVQMHANRIIHTNNTETNLPSTITSTTIKLAAQQEILIYSTITAQESIDIFAKNNSTINSTISAPTIAINTENFLNSGTIETPDQSGTAINITAATFKTNGTIRTNTTNYHAGTISITATQYYALITGIVSANSINHHAGTITISAPNLNITTISATITANSIYHDAGTITIGGTKQMPLTTALTIDTNTTIQANSGSRNAGSITIFANTTNFFGTATATSNTGLGGFIELSAKENLNHNINNNTQQLNVSSVYSTNGTILIDPENIYIIEPTSSFELFKQLITAENTNTSLVDSNENRGITTLGNLNNFGQSVALNNTYALIGSPNESGGGNAYLYKLDGANTFNSTCQTSAVSGASGFSTPWCSLASLQNTPTSFTSRAFFGQSVALNGVYALIGSRGESGGKGNAYLYELDGTSTFNSTCQTSASGASGSTPWCSLASLQNTPTSFTSRFYFGYSVALNGAYALIGSRGESGEQGNAYLYKLDGTSTFNSTCQTSAVSGASGSTPWCSLASTQNTPTSFTSRLYFGQSVALNYYYALIGSPNESGGGNAYLYKLDGTSAFNSTCETSASGASGSTPWCSLASLQNTPNSFTQRSSFGQSVALNSNYALIGSIGELGGGNAYLYKLDGTSTFNSTCQILASGASGSTPWCSLASTQNTPTSFYARYYIVYSVALNSDYALIGSYNESGSKGNAYLYKLDGTSTFNSTCQTSASGASGINTPWCSLASTQNQNTPSSFTSRLYFGRSVALNNTFALIGSYGESGGKGNAYLYKLDGSNHISSTNCGNTIFPSPWCSLASLQNTPSSFTSRLYFGYSVALNSTYALIGSYGELGGGNAYLYKLDGTSTFNSACQTSASGASGSTPWCSLASLQNTPSSFTSRLYFGESVALNSTYALIGSRGESGGKGNAYLYKLDGTSTFNSTCQTSASGASGINTPWCSLASTQNQNTPSSFTSRLHFGYSVALNSTYALIGSYGELGGGNAYLYKLDGSNHFSSTNCGNTILPSPWCSFAASYPSSIISRDGFGSSVALNSTYALIGSYGELGGGNAYLYKLDGTSTFNSDCQTSASGASGINTPWCSFAASYPSSIISRDRFGTSVALNNTYALIGSYYESGGKGNAYLYKLDGTNTFNSTCQTSASGASGSTPWCSLASTLNQNTPNSFTSRSSFSNFGISVALNESFALIGSYIESVRGNAYLYKLDGTSTFNSTCQTSASGASGSTPWCSLVSTSNTYPSFNRDTFSKFGISVALNDTYALIGSYGELGGGNAYLYKLDGTSTFNSACQTSASGASGSTPWCSLASLQNTPSSFTSRLYFGYSVALNSTYALIGSYGELGGGNAYLYKLDGTSTFNSTCQTSASGASGINTPWCSLASLQNTPTSFTTRAIFGYSVALNDNYALIGSHGESGGGNAYLYKLDGTNTFNSACKTSAVPSASGFSTPWCSLASLQNTPYSFTQRVNFGYSVALNSNYAIIGSPEESGGGNAYLYKLDGTSTFNSTCQTSAVSGASGSTPWCSLASTQNLYTPTSFTSRAYSSSKFGYSVALNSTYALIGSYGESGRGNAYLYKLDGTSAFNSDCQTSASGSTPWCSLASTQNQNTPYSFTQRVHFGESVALNSTYALIGSRGELGGGNAYLYKLDGTGTFNSTCQILASGASGSTPWCSLASTQNFPSSFVGSVALNDTYALIGSYAESGGGNAYLYRLDGTTIFNSTCQTSASGASGSTPWCSLASLQNTPSSFTSRYFFGISVALNSDYALIGSHSESSDKGNAYLYKLDGTSTFNSACQTSAVSGASGSTPWCSLASTQNTPTSFTNRSAFGWSVALNSDYALIGSYGELGGGNAYLYKLDGTSTFNSTCQTSAVSGASGFSTPWCSLASLQNTPPSFTNRLGFGWSVALNDNYALIGSFGESGGGNAYLYKLDGTNTFNSACKTSAVPSASGFSTPWCSLASLQNTPYSFTQRVNFGYSVALNSNYAIIGSPEESGGGNAYLYKLDGTSTFNSTCQTSAVSGASGFSTPWCSLASLQKTPNSFTTRLEFGTSVALNNFYALIGSPLEPLAGESGSKGNAYLYKLDGTSTFNSACQTSASGASGSTPWCSLASLQNTPSQSFSVRAFFGHSVALNDTYALIGSYGDSLIIGNAYLYRLDGTNTFNSTCQTSASGAAGSTPWCSLESTNIRIIPTSFTYRLGFGYSVALNSTYALIGSFFERLPGESRELGNAYLYRLDGTNTFNSNCQTSASGASGINTPWCSLASIQNTPTLFTSRRSFGKSVALNDTYALIGSSASGGKGNAYLYKLDGSYSFNSLCSTSSTLTSAWCSLSSYFAYDRLNALSPVKGFGSNIATYGNLVVLGTYYESNSRGNVYLYNTDSNNWLSLIGTIGSHSLNIADGAQFGKSVAINSRYVLIGAPFQNLFPNSGYGGGSAYLYDYTGINENNNWQDLSHSLISKFGELSSCYTCLFIQNRQFGYSVALNEGFALIGAPRWGINDNLAGDVFLYALSGTNTFNPNCLTSSSPVTSTPTSPWCRLRSSGVPPVTNSSYGFGRAVALNAEYALIGAPFMDNNSGNAYLYKINGAHTFNANCQTSAVSGASGFNTPWCSLNTIDIDSDTAGVQNPLLAMSGGRLGSSVALSSTYALLGMPGDSLNRGNAVLYALTGDKKFTSSCTITGTLTSPFCTLSSSTGFSTLALPSGSSFGFSVALNDSGALIGAPTKSILGEAYYYDLSGTGVFNQNTICASASASPWCVLSSIGNTNNPIKKLTPECQISGCLVGYSVAFSSSRMYVGAPHWLYTIGTVFSYPLLGSIFTPAQINTILTSGNYEIAATSTIFIGASLNNFGSSNKLTLTARSISFIGTSTLNLGSSSNFVKISNSDSIVINGTTLLRDVYVEVSSLRQLLGKLHILESSNSQITNLFVKQTSGNVNLSDLTPISFNGNLGFYALAGSLNAGQLSVSSGTVTLNSTSDIVATLNRSNANWSTANLVIENQNLGAVSLTGNIYLLNAIPTNFSNRYAVNVISGDANIDFNLTRNLARVELVSNQIITLSANITTEGFSAANRFGGIHTTNNGQITANNVSLIILGEGKIGSESAPIVVNKTTGTWSSSSLSADGEDVYIKSATPGLWNAFIYGITVSIEQTVGSIDISSSFYLDNNRALDGLTLKASAVGANITTSNNAVITCSSCRLTLLAPNGSIGSIANPITINYVNTQLSGSWLIANAGNSIYIKSPNSGLYKDSFTFGSAGTLSLEQSSGNMILDRNISVTSTQTLILKASGVASDISLASYSVQGGTVQLIATGSLLRNTGNVTASTIRLDAPTIGSVGVPFYIDRPNGDWNSSNLQFINLNGLYYIETVRPESWKGLPSGFAGTFNLKQTQNAINITSHINFPSATIKLHASSGGSVITTLSSTAITASRIILQGSNIGSSTNPIEISRGSGTWDSTSLQISLDSVSSNVYIKSATSGLLSVNLSDLPVQFNGEFNFIQTAGNVLLANSLSFPNATLNLTVSSGTVSFANYSMNFSRVGLTSGDITTTGGGITANSLSLTSSGHIGTSTQPLVITKLNVTDMWNSSTLYARSANSGNIYLKSNSQGLTSGDYLLTGTGILSLEQSVGDLVLSNHLYTQKNLRLVATSGSILSANYRIQASRLELVAPLGSIGTESQPVRIIGYGTGGADTFASGAITLTACTSNCAVGVGNIYIARIGTSLSDSTFITKRNELCTAVNGNNECTTVASGQTITKSGIFKLTNFIPDLDILQASGTAGGTCTSSTSLSLSTSAAGASITNDTNCTLSTTSVSLIADLDIGSLANPIKLGSQSITSLTLTSQNGSIYISKGADVLSIFINGASISHGTAGRLFLYQTGNISVNTSRSYPTLALTLRSDSTSNITFSNNANLEFKSISLFAGGSIGITGSGTLTAENIAIQTSNSSGSIGSSGNPLTLVRSSNTWTSNNLNLTSSGNIFLKSASAGILNATLNSFSS
ncbi:MAG: filamentous hemagglutinin N-terminal domain-containing protein, partial [Methylacidiphilales bacterium]|nr:filamentous hemagglutinin N-terminal domain-containing protein [Candidatus Methylacidiphilales bacterium]